MSTDGGGFAAGSRGGDGHRLRIVDEKGPSGQRNADKARWGVGGGQRWKGWASRGNDVCLTVVTWESRGLGVSSESTDKGSVTSGVKETPLQAFYAMGGVKTEVRTAPRPQATLLCCTPPSCPLHTPGPSGAPSAPSLRPSILSLFSHPPQHAVALTVPPQCSPWGWLVPRPLAPVSLQVRPAASLQSHLTHRHLQPTAGGTCAVLATPTRPSWWPPPPASLTAGPAARFLAGPPPGTRPPCHPGTRLVCSCLRHRTGGSFCPACSLPRGLHNLAPTLSRSLLKCPFLSEVHPDHPLCLYFSF